MKKYESPVVILNEALAEGVYAASGTTVSGDTSCYVRQGNWAAPEKTTTGYKFGGQIDYVWGSNGAHQMPSKIKVSVTLSTSIDNWEKVLLNDYAPVTIEASSTNSIVVSFSGETTGNATACFSLLFYVDAETAPVVSGMTIECFH